MLLQKVCQRVIMLLSTLTEITMETTKASKILGILGGLGPMASVYFYEMLTEHTKAEADQEHLDILMSRCS